jgi:hypothetical protein
MMTDADYCMMTLYYMLTDVLVMQADCALTCDSMYSPYGLISPCGLMDHYHW